MADRKKIKIIVILGPTASGKSGLALRLAKLTQGKPFREKYGIKGAEIISADSRQVYRGMDIGTGKVDQDRIQKSKIKSQNLGRGLFYSRGIRHWLIDVANPKKQFTAADFKRMGEKAIEEILGKGKIPIIVGGTGFYIDALLNRVNLPDVPPDRTLRAKLEKLSAKQLFERLKKLDPVRAKNIDAKNKRRLVRAIEVASGRYRVASSKYQESDYDILWIGVKLSKEELAKRIKKRLNERIKQGMVAETRKLRDGGLTRRRLYDLGLEYRWLSLYLKRETQSAKRKIRVAPFIKSEEYKNLLRDIIRYSKRQMTWFKRNKNVVWVSGKEAARALARRWMTD
ncbi:MAG: tRNA (adenosine(37)-N6)-dimethylallyltransferase MiaA [Candidatus Yanofskybacteria bacterium RIFCSPHIGHO2_01_FULL_45_42]|uniref:tRNA dimethylallyltransferase n=3 Tax=Candidatus Yanofskyibacteriota TaxID=1752733 RepID=A0A1F8H3V9_9BACT|nr:MAG: tRNA (adenosine(37)-N6)-dimethylallyltransferase MiaA [Candidatus Yanofskybacteria bacterium RIFCSPHIGHO2_01_FULL_45_42]OGN15834.1 MAG: tRNA (adenosine(37)-N6)-dimethylallyltransferase MiaA [Candidatus Yanofskybacteria bacterium RIFCSPHIGHO2_02_FULL_46_19]OGN26043.1 MAG: tRNA (adenosine(37)-N6)-dimethylallyltransferase MiaA [Candidatus Yanofskybacteria bacterium RIFCSPLOWO2_01_FULL_45_72]OGN32272.1 MAG: tRNA (adenosine(37)-N6)-dimethylallyltransferase MiaA [Candidatus Yanofskybacteria ba